MGNILTPEIITKEMRLSSVIQIIHWQEQKIIQVPKVQTIQKQSLLRKLNRCDSQIKKM